MSHNEKTINTLEAALTDSFPYVAHYTTYEGLCGILRTQKLWATHYKFLNDSSELSHGRQHIADIFKKNISSLPDTDRFFNVNSDTLDIIWNLLSPQEFFITSFCGIPKNDDTYNLGMDGLLSQWRGYGNNKGFAIVFDSKILAESYQRFSKKCKEHLGTDQEPECKDCSIRFFGYGFNKVLYENDLQMQSTDSDIREMSKIIDDFAKSSMDDIENGREQVEVDSMMMTKFIKAVHFIFFSIKHRAFHQENEIRFFCTNRINIGTALTISPYEINVEQGIPRLKIDFDISAIKRIIIAPHQEADRVKLSIQYFLSQHGYDPREIDIVQSSIPLISK